jgi:tripartite ATP-independent transporter DctP family solute receptor
MMLKKCRCLVLAMALVLVFVSCTTFAAKKPIKLVFGHVFPADHFYCKGDLYFKELVEKNSKGKILIDYFPASQLGGSAEQAQALRDGSQQLGLPGGGILAQYLPKMATIDLPYLYRDDDHQLKVLKRLSSLVGKKEFEAKTGMHILSARIRSPRHLTTKFPVNKLEDIKGIKIRVPENPVSLALWKALGTIPTVIPAADTYTALATGTVDAQENPYDSIYLWKYYEQVKYCAYTGHIRESTIMVISTKCWYSLTASQKKIISDAAAKNAEMGIRDAKKADEDYYNLLVKAGMKFTKPDLVSFREKAKTIWGKFGDPELIKRIEAVK